MRTDESTKTKNELEAFEFHSTMKKKNREHLSKRGRATL